MLLELEARYDSRQSFYGKAKVEVVRTSVGQVMNLYSYGTLVSRITDDFNNLTRTYEYFGRYSQTTSRHQHEFFLQNCISNEELKELYKNGELVVNL